MAEERKPGGRLRLRRVLVLAVALLPATLLAFSCSGCSPVYVARAGWAQWRILAARRPLGEVLEDPATDPESRRKLLLARQARAFARHVLEMEVGEQYTSYAEAKDEVLAWIVSAARKDRLEAKTWWFPVVGRVPYKGYPTLEAAEKAQGKLEADGFDTFLRPTSAFSTLGWFSDPILSTFLRQDDVDLVATVIHELAHSHLWVPGNVRFNESFATFAGDVGAIRFFCGPGDVTSGTVECAESRRRWNDAQAFSTFLDGLVEELEVIYARPGSDTASRVAARDSILSGLRESLGQDPTTPAPVGNFLARPLNNAVILARMQYYHRLEDFQRFLEREDGDLSAALRALGARAGAHPDPFLLLPPGRG
jgi:predicted aminopeptidase